MDKALRIIFASLLLLLLPLSYAFCFVNDPNIGYREIDGDIIHCDFSYIPVSRPYFIEGSEYNSGFSNKAVAKIGTLSYTWNEDCPSTALSKTGNYISQVNNYIHQLYFFGPNTQNNPNYVNLVSAAGQTFKAKLFGVMSKNTEKVIDLTREAWPDPTKNMALFSNNSGPAYIGAEVKMRSTDQYDLYLVISTYDPDLVLGGPDSLKLESTVDVFRDITCLSYRINKNPTGQGRGQSSSKNTTGLSVLSYWAIEQGFTYNLDPYENYDPNVQFTVSVTETNNPISIYTDEPQEIAQAIIISQRLGFPSDYAIKVKFYDINDTTPSSPFKVRNKLGYLINGQDVSYPYNLIFHPDTQSSINVVKGQEYVWVSRSSIQSFFIHSSRATISVSGIKTSMQYAFSGDYVDTIIMEIWPVDTI